MARTVENSVDHALEALLRPGLMEASRLSSQVFLVEPRINEMEMLIDDQDGPHGREQRGSCTGGPPASRPYGSFPAFQPGVPGGAPHQRNGNANRRSRWPAR